jgi:molybdate transport system substrate-binding protein
VRVAAAASLREVMEPIRDLFLETHPNVDIPISYAASGVLRRQIENADAADVFISANRRHMDALVSAELVNAETLRVFTRNQLVVGSSADSGLRLDSLHGLVDPAFARIAIGSPRTAPVGEFAQAALESVGIWEEIQDHLVIAENAPQLVAYLRRGEVDATIMYLTDLRQLGDEGVELLRIDPQTYPRIEYPIAVTAGAHSSDLAREFVTFTAEPAPQGILREAGFMPVE